MSEAWKYVSLEWIHKIREENYRRTKSRKIKDLVGKTAPEVERLIHDLGLTKIEPLPRGAGKRN
jgi:hypothetical protein